MTEKSQGQRRVLVGRVTSDKMDKTIVVEVDRRLKHPVYKKYISKKRRYMAHDAEDNCHIGDVVEIQEHRPLSKNKRWIVSRVVERAELT
jgi:small subunit ribosomal protein S17